MGHYGLMAFTEPPSFYSIILHYKTLQDQVCPIFKNGCIATDPVLFPPGSPMQMRARTITIYQYLSVCLSVCLYLSKFSTNRDAPNECSTLTSFLSREDMNILLSAFQMPGNPIDRSTDRFRNHESIGHGVAVKHPKCMKRR